MGQAISLVVRAALKLRNCTLNQKQNVICINLQLTCHPPVQIFNKMIRTVQNTWLDFIRPQKNYRTWWRLKLYSQYINVNSDRSNHVSRMKTCSMDEEIMFKHSNGMWLQSETLNHNEHNDKLRRQQWITHKNEQQLQSQHFGTCTPTHLFLH